jgi:hypothetical protein
MRLVRVAGTYSAAFAVLGLVWGVLLGAVLGHAFFLVLGSTVTGVAAGGLATAGHLAVDRAGGPS